MTALHGLSLGLALMCLASCAGPGNGGGLPAGDVVPAESQPLPDLNVRSQEQSAGLFIGVENFRFVQKDLPYTVNDAVDLAYSLSVEHRLLPVRNVLLLLSGEPYGASIKKKQEMMGEAVIGLASKDRIESALREQAQLVGPQGIFYVFFATHGYSDGERQFLMPEDSAPDSPDGAVSAEGILQATQIVSGGQILLILDTCRLRVATSLAQQGGVAIPSGSRSAWPEGRIDTLAKTLASRPGYAVLFATGSDGIALPDDERLNGILTGALLDGFHCGGADAQSIAMTLDDLSSFVQDEVSRRSEGRQNAQLLKADGFRDFVMARCGPIGVVLHPRDGGTVSSSEVLRARVDHSGFYATAVVQAESNGVYYHQQSRTTFWTEPGEDLRITVQFGRPDSFQVYVGLSTDPLFLVGEDQLNGLPNEDNQGRPVYWLGPVHVTLPEDEE